jgi:hypothetical protein
VASAEHHGVEVVFAVYLKRAAAAPATRIRAAQLATWAATVARRWPEVRTWIGPNEPNQPRFWRPQFGRGCVNASGAAYATALGAMYDALKTVDADIQVLGSLSPRGNDLCRARSNVSTSPVRFLAALGKAYRRSRGRDPCTPLMDGLSFHPYPPRNQDPPAKGYVWPKIGLPDLGRLKQAFWDAFRGTCQQTFGEGLPLHLNELGYQTASRRSGYSGRENVTPISEARQGSFYAAAIARAACDPAVASLNIFHLVDEAERARFQSGLLRIDRTRKASFAPVRAAIVRAERGCGGRLTRWRPARRVIGAGVDFGRLGRSSPKRAAWTFRIVAREGASYDAGILRAGDPPTATPVLRASGRLRAQVRLLVRFRGRLAPGSYVYAARLRAEANASRMTTFVSKPFTVR